MEGAKIFCTFVLSPDRVFFFYFVVRNLKLILSKHTNFIFTTEIKMLGLMYVFLTFPDVSRFVSELLDANISLTEYLQTMNVTDLDQLQEKY